MLLSAALIARTLPSDSWWRKLLHFIFIVSCDHFPLMSIVYNHGTACCVMKFKAGLSAPRISHSVYSYIHIFIWIVFSHSGQTGMMNVWLRSCEGVGEGLQLSAGLICGQSGNCQLYWKNLESLRVSTLSDSRASSSSQDVAPANKVLRVMLRWCYSKNVLKGDVFCHISIFTCQRFKICLANKPQIHGWMSVNQFIIYWMGGKTQGNPPQSNVRGNFPALGFVYSPLLIWSSLINQLIFLSQGLFLYTSSLIKADIQLAAKSWLPVLS